MNLLDKLTHRTDFIPETHKTCDQWAAEWGVGQRRARELLSAGVKSGTVKTVVHRVPSATGSIIPIPHYYDAEEDQKTRGPGDNGGVVPDSAGKRRQGLPRRQDEHGVGRSGTRRTDRSRVTGGNHQS